MATGVHTGGYHFDPATASNLEAALHQAAQDALTAAQAWAGTAADGVAGYGEKVGEQYRSKVLEPAASAHASIYDGLQAWARQVQAWSTSTTAADQDAAAGFGGGDAGTATTLPPAQTGSTPTA